MGQVVYVSFFAMDASGETSDDVCGLNDFALVKIDSPFESTVSPRVHGWGGPIGIGKASATDGEVAYTSGGGMLRTSPALQELLGVPPVQEWTRDRQGWLAPSLTAATQANPDWRVHAYFVGQCLPGDSGSPVLDEKGAALAVVLVIAIQAVLHHAD